MPTQRSVLFVCTGNSARSILAEALVNDPAIGRGQFRGYSAGSHPRGEVQPIALEVLRDNRISVDGLRSKSWDEFAAPGAPNMDLVITVCDQAAAETCPVWPGHPASEHWSIPDPAAVAGDAQTMRRAYKTAFQLIRSRVVTLVESTEA